MKKTGKEHSNTKRKRHGTPPSPFQEAQKHDRELAKFYGKTHATKPAADDKSAERELAEFENKLPALIRRALWYDSQGLDDPAVRFVEWDEIRQMLSNQTEALRKEFEGIIRRNPKLWNRYAMNEEADRQRRRRAGVPSQYKKHRGRPKKPKIAREIAELRRQVPPLNFKQIAATLNQRHGTEDKNHADHVTENSALKLSARYYPIKN